VERPTTSRKTQMRQDRQTRRYEPPSPTPDDGRNGSVYASRNGAAADVRSDSLYRVIVLGYIVAASMPPIGLILGIGIAARTTKANSRHGVGIIVVSIVASVVWTLIILSGALSTPSADF
jgi:hypothetical protein